MITEKMKLLQMVTIAENGDRKLATDEEAWLWFSKHVKTHMHAEAVFAGIPTAMIDGSKVVFERRGCNECMSAECQQI